MRFIYWLRSWFGVTQKTRSIDRLERRIKQAIDEKNKNQLEMEERKEVLFHLQTDLEEEIKKTKSVIQACEETDRKLEAALAAAMESLKTAEQIVIPGLVQANDTFQQAWSAESAHAAARAAIIVNARSEGTG